MKKKVLISSSLLIVVVAFLFYAAFFIYNKNSLQCLEFQSGRAVLRTYYDEPFNLKISKDKRFQDYAINLDEKRFLRVDDRRSGYNIDALISTSIIDPGPNLIKSTFNGLDSSYLYLPPRRGLEEDYKHYVNLGNYDLSVAYLFHNFTEEEKIAAQKVLDSITFHLSDRSSKREIIRECTDKYEISWLHKRIDPYYTKKWDSVYYLGNEIEDADGKTFQVLEHAYSKDKNNVFLLDTIQEHLDAESFQVLSSYHVKDKNNAYWRMQPIEGADIETFEVIGGDYSRDKNYIYQYNSRFTEVDIDTFEFLDEFFVKDKNAVYTFRGVLKGADPKTFQALGGFYGKDKNNVYWDDEIVENVSPDGFKVIDGRGKDIPFIYGEYKGERYIRGYLDRD